MEESKPKKTDHLFKPGQSGNPKGRPPGSHDKHFVRVETWLARYFEDLEDLPQEQRLTKMEAILDKFFSKIQVIAASPADSVANVTAQVSAADKLAAAERYGQQPGNAGTANAGPGNPAVYVGTGPAESQAPA